MDILSHGLWGATILRNRKVVWWAFLSGMAPDILGSGGAFIYLLTIGKFWGTGTWQLLPPWAKELYHFHHSLLAALIYFLLLRCISRRHGILILPYLLHILMDAFTHATDGGGRLLYPLHTSLGISGLNWWEHWWIMALNIAGLAVVNGFFWLRGKQSISSEHIIR
ncbi:MAG: hypothetical protein HY052_01440 [Proteobacteria bacterium]|nr:hypothetical protein [Pseudomonadota bacterium]